MSETCKCYRAALDRDTEYAAVMTGCDPNWIVTSNCPIHRKSRLRIAEERIEKLENWKASSEKSTPDWQEVGKALGLSVGTDVPKALLPAIWNLKNEVEIWKIQAKTARYGIDCACLWRDGKVISTCAAHGEVVRKAEDRLAERYRKLTESR